MLTAKDIMNSKLVSVTPADSILNAYKLMHTKEIRHLPVFDKDQKLVGMLSDRDILRAIVFEEKSVPEVKVGDFMAWPIQTISEKATVPQVIDKITNFKISALLVTNDYGIPSGIITTDDLILSFLDVLHKDEELLHKLVVHKKKG